MPKKGTKYLELRGLLARLDITQDELGGMTGLGKRNISTRFCGVAPWRLEEVYRVCDNLEIPYDQIPKYFPPGEVTT